ncbi:hypothetical protein P7C73_g4495, partial [Tremellales sp. Uapishka_1]
MAKSLRSKAKMAARHKKRTNSFYQVADADRSVRLAERLHSKTQKEAPIKEGEEGAEDDVEADAEMEEVAPKKVSTSAPRDNRREQWRMSKGMTPRPESKGLNRQGTAKATRKSGRPSRRR